MPRLAVCLLSKMAITTDLRRIYKFYEMFTYSQFKKQKIYSIQTILFLYSRITAFCALSFPLYSLCANLLGLVFKGNFGTRTFNPFEFLEAYMLSALCHLIFMQDYLTQNQGWKRNFQALLQTCDHIFERIKMGKDERNQFLKNVKVTMRLRHLYSM